MYPRPAADDRNTCWCLPIPYQPFPSGDGNQAFPPSENSSNATMRLQIEDTCPAEYEPCPTSESQPPLGCLFNFGEGRFQNNFWACRNEDFPKCDRSARGHALLWGTGVCVKPPKPSDAASKRTN